MSVLSIISLLLSIIGVIIYNLLSSSSSSIGLFVTISLISIVLPPIAKKFRISHGKRGSGLEIAAIVIGGFNFYCMIFALTKLPMTIAYLGWLISGISYALVKETIKKANCCDTHDSEVANTPAASPATHSANMSADTETVSVRSETASEGVSNEPIEVMAPINPTSISSQAPYQTSAKEPTKRLVLNKHTIVYIGLSLLIVLAVGFGILQTVSVQKLKTEVTDLEKQITTKESTMLHLEKQIVRLNADIRSLNRDIASYEKLASFVDDYVVLIEDDGTNLYHKFSCYKFRGDSFWVYNTENAVQQGFSPCPICNG